MATNQGQKRKIVDFSRLEVGSLQRYAKKYKLPQGGNREDLLNQVSRHFSTQQFMLDEEEVVLNFIRALKSSSVRPRQAGVYPNTGARPAMQPMQQPMMRR